MAIKRNTAPTSTTGPLVASGRSGEGAMTSFSAWAEVPSPVGPDQPMPGPGETPATPPITPPPGAPSVPEPSPPRQPDTPSPDVPETDPKGPETPDSPERPEPQIPPQP